MTDKCMKDLPHKWSLTVLNVPIKEEANTSVNRGEKPTKPVQRYKQMKQCVRCGHMKDVL